MADDHDEERPRFVLVLSGRPEGERSIPERIIDVSLTLITGHRIGIGDTSLIALDAGHVKQEVDALGIRAKHVHSRKPFIHQPVGK
jgi:hypothetical protein